MTGLVNRMKFAITDAEQAAREIYYAMSFLAHNHPARANLNVALKRLGVNSPSEVGLSSSVLTRKDVT